MGEKAEVPDTYKAVRNKKNIHERTQTLRLHIQTLARLNIDKCVLHEIR